MRLGEEAGVKGKAKKRPLGYYIYLERHSPTGIRLPHWWKYILQSRKSPINSLNSRSAPQNGCRPSKRRPA